MNACENPLELAGETFCPVILGPLVSTPAPPVILGPLETLPETSTTVPPAPAVEELADTGVGLESSVLGLALLAGGLFALAGETIRARRRP